MPATAARLLRCAACLEAEERAAEALGRRKDALLARQGSGVVVHP
jgi:hypothetical protein